MEAVAEWWYARMEVLAAWAAIPIPGEYILGLQTLMVIILATLSVARLRSWGRFDKMTISRWIGMLSPIVVALGIFASSVLSARGEHAGQMHELVTMLGLLGGAWIDATRVGRRRKKNAVR